MALVVKPRKSRGDEKTATANRTWQAEIATVGPFVASFRAEMVKPRGEDGKAQRDAKSVPTGRVNVSVLVPSEEGSQRFSVLLQSVNATRGALTVMANHWDEFAEAVALAIDAVDDDERRTEAEQRLAAYLAVNGPDAVEETPEETETEEVEPAVELDPSLVAGLVTGCPK